MSDFCQIECQIECQTGCQDVCQVECQDICLIECQHICQAECQNVHQVDCLNICPIECQKICQIECQNICQIECHSLCHGEDHSKQSSFLMLCLRPAAAHIFLSVHIRTNAAWKADVRIAVLTCRVRRLLPLDCFLAPPWPQGIPSWRLVAVKG